LLLSTIVLSFGIRMQCICLRTLIQCVCSQNHAVFTFWRRNYFFLILAHPVYKM
jgi:hypothetical protein